jgi:hypothetical protein
VKDENGGLFADSHILNRYKNFFTQLLNVHSVSDVRQIEVHKAEWLVLGPRPFKVEIPVVKFKKYKSPGSDQILADLVQARGKTLLRFMNSLLLFEIRKESIIVPVRKKGWQNWL